MQSVRSLKDVWIKFQFILTTSQKRWGVVLILMTIIGALIETLGVSIILPLVQVMVTPDELWRNKYIVRVAEYFNITENAQLIFMMGGVVIFVYLIKNLFLLFLSWVRIKYACKIQRELSSEMLRSYIRRGYTYFLNASMGELIRGMTTSVQNTYQALYQIFKLLSEVLTAFCICIFLIVIDWKMALCIILLAGICLLFILFGFRNWVKSSGEKYYKYTGIINGIILQAFNGIKEVLVMNRKQYFIDKYEEQYKKQQSGLIGQTISTESPAFIIEAICITGFIIVVCLKSLGTNDLGNMVPQLAAFAVAAFRILPSLGRISSNFNLFIFCIPYLNETYENLEEVRENQNNINYDSMNISDSENHSFEKQLEIHNIQWRYKSTDKKILSDVNLTIKKGQSVAFIGQSGAGKTTLADIILGLLIPQNGNIELDGIDICEIKSNWSEIVGFVPQNVYLTDDTIRNNVAFGLNEKDINDDNIWHALKQAQLKDFVINLPLGIHTMVGERGIRFSGGQRQRIAIARALYNNPDILVLDEATSALDTETETAVMESIEALQGNKTLIIIAHRLTTIKKCDVIYEIVDGKAIERDKKQVFI